MRSFCLNTILAAGLLAGTALIAHAEILTRIEINVPFAFQVGNTPMPAGNYEIYQPNETGALFIRATGAPGVVATIVAPVSERVGSKASFMHIDGKYFPSSISLGDGREVHLVSHSK